MAVQRAEATADLRSQILAAAQRVIQARGAASATTRAIAEEARCAEGSIYRYFTDKHALFHAVAGEHFTKFVELAETLPQRAGSSTDPFPARPGSSSSMTKNDSNRSIITAWKSACLSGK